MSTALVPVRRRAALLELTAGAVAAQLRLGQIDRRRKVAFYDLYLANRAAGSVTCRFFGTRDGSVHEFGMLEVAGMSTAHSRFSVPYDRARRCRLLHVRVAGEDIALLAEAQPPSPPGWSAAVRAGVTLGVLGISALGAAGLTQLIGSPPAVALDLAHTTVPAETRSAALVPQLPAVVVAPERPARIVSFSARRDRYNARSSVLVSYGAVAEAGSIRVLDPAGALVGHAAFSRGGTNRILLIRDVGTVPLRTELVVYRGRSQASAAVEIPPEAVQPSAAPAVPQAIGETTVPQLPGEDAQHAVPLGPADPFVLPERAVASQRLRIAIRARFPDMRIALQDQIGSTIDEQPVPAGATAVNFTAPASNISQIYYIVCTYTRHAAEETIVRSIRIFPS
ncbi:MAG: hypothetical protein NVS3B28_22640 [Candidatus Velthaea sp.]